MKAMLIDETDRHLRWTEVPDPAIGPEDVLIEVYAAALNRADLLQREGLSPGMKYLDCGVLMYDLLTQDVHAGGSGCGCSAAVLCAHILPAMERGVWRRVLFAGTGALMSPLTCQQGCSIPGVCHAVTIERGECA